MKNLCPQPDNSWELCSWLAQLFTCTAKGAPQWMLSCHVELLLFALRGNEPPSIFPWQKGQGSQGACLLTSVMWDCAMDLICWALTSGLRHIQAGWHWSKGTRARPWWDQCSSLAGHLKFSALEKHRAVAENSSHFTVLIQQITCEICVCLFCIKHIPRVWNEHWWWSLFRVYCKWSQ